MKNHLVTFKHRGKDLYFQIPVLSHLNISDEELCKKAKEQIVGHFSLTGENMVSSMSDISKVFSEIQLLKDGNWVVVERLEEENNASNKPVSEPVATSIYPFITLHTDDDREMDVSVNQIVSYVRMRSKEPNVYNRHK